MPAQGGHFGGAECRKPCIKTSNFGAETGIVSKLKALNFKVIILKGENFYL